LCLSGFGFWSHDIGGFEQTASADVYKRWCAFGLLSSHSRLHGSSSYRVPWLFDEEAVDVLRFFTKLKCRLMPYLFGAARQAHETGVPVMRGMMLEFPGDPTCDYLDRQYMLGESFLVAPIFSPDGVVTYYLPAGRWTNFFTGEVVEGPGWVRETHDFMSIPLMVRPNSVVAVGSREDRPDYDYGDGVILRAYELAEGSSVAAVVPSAAGDVDMTFELKREGAMITVERHGKSKRWQLLLVGIGSVASVEGGAAEISTKGALVTPARDTDCLRISLEVAA
jgi:alpha-D-xyloside xylohydrolase